MKFGSFLVVSVIHFLSLEVTTFLQVAIFLEVITSLEVFVFCLQNIRITIMLKKYKKRSLSSTLTMLGSTINLDLQSNSG